jgi:hypothetical protein
MSDIRADTRRLRRGNRKRGNRIGILGDGVGNLYADQPGLYWAYWSGGRDANGNTSIGQVFRVRPGSANYIPQAGRAVKIGLDEEGQLEVKGAVFADMLNADLDPRGLNPNDPFRQFIYTPNIVTFRSDSVATAEDEALLVNLDQLFYVDAYGQWLQWNGTAVGTHLDLTSYVPDTDLHCYALVYLRTFENTPAVAVSTAQSLFTPLDFTDIQEAFDAADPESLPSRVYTLANNQDTLIASPVHDIDLRQWVNVPARLGNPNPIRRKERVRAEHQLVYHGTLTIINTLQVIGNVVVL